MPNTRDWLFRRFRRSLKTSAPYTTEGESIISTNGEGHKTAEGNAEENATGFSVDKTHTTKPEIDGPDTQIIRNPPTRLQRRIRDVQEFNQLVVNMALRIWNHFWSMRPWREKSAIELEREAEIKARKKLKRILQKEGRLFARRASNSYARMGLCYVPPMNRRSIINGIRKVEFSTIVAERNAIWLQIATDRLPWGVDILKLTKDEGVLTNLSASLRHHVQAYYDVEKGAWLCIERGRGIRGIPQEVTYEKMYNLIPKDAHRLTIPFGEGVNSSRLNKSLRDMPHLLIGGSTGQGKTSFLNVIMATLIRNNTPEDLKIVLVDLKNGIEFDMYKGVPHLWKMGGTDKPEDEQIAPDGIVGRPEQVIKLLYRLKAEGERRLDLFRKLEVTNIDEFNRGRTKSRIPRVVVMIDEWARVALSPEGRHADDILSEITATYRAVGFHVILATQTPISRVVSGLIKTNFNARLAFGVPSISASIVMLDSKRAVGLSPAGRAIFQYGTTVIEVQVPYIKKSELLEVLDEARSDGGRVEDELGLLEIFQYSLSNLGGSLSRDRLLDYFSNRIGKNALEDKLKTLDGMLVDIDGVEYEVKAPFGNVPRRLELYDESPVNVPPA